MVVCTRNTTKKLLAFADATTVDDGPVPPPLSPVPVASTALIALPCAADAPSRKAPKKDCAEVNALHLQIAALRADNKQALKLALEAAEEQHERDHQALTDAFTARFDVLTKAVVGTQKALDALIVEHDDLALLIQSSYTGPTHAPAPEDPNPHRPLASLSEILTMAVQNDAQNRL